MPTDIQASMHGRQLGLDRFGRLLSKGFASGEPGTGKQFDVDPNPHRAVLFEDFLGAGVALSTTIAAVGNAFRSRKGSDAACVDWTVTPAVNGTIAGVIGNTTASMAVSGSQLDSGLSWKANQNSDGNVLVFETRLHLSKTTNIAVFAGFTDQTGALEMPIQSAASADTLTTNATDGVGFMFDTSMNTDNWWLTGVANDVDATAQNSTYAPVASTFETLRVEVNSDGSAYFYRNGLIVGSKMTGAVTATVALTPVIAGFNRTTSGAGTITVDYIYVAGNRS